MHSSSSKHHHQITFPYSFYYPFGKDIYYDPKNPVNFKTAYFHYYYYFHALIINSYAQVNNHISCNMSPTVHIQYTFPLYKKAKIIIIISKDLFFTSVQEHNQYHVRLPCNPCIFFRKGHIQYALTVHNQCKIFQSVYIQLESIYVFFFFFYKEIIFFKHIVNVCFCCFIKKGNKKKETLLDSSLLKDIGCKGKNCDRRMGSRIHCKRIRCRREYNFVSNLEKKKNIRESKMNESTF